MAAAVSTGAILAVLVAALLLYPSVVTRPEPHGISRLIVQAASLTILLVWVAGVPAIALLLARAWRGAPGTALITAVMAVAIGAPAVLGLLSFANACANSYSFPLPGMRC